MRLLSGFFLLIAVLLAAADVTASVAAHEIVLNSVGDVFARLGVAWPNFDGSAGGVGLALAAEALRKLKDTPAFASPLSLSVGCWLLLRRKRRPSPSTRPVSEDPRAQEQQRIAGPAPENNAGAVGNRTQGALQVAANAIPPTLARQASVGPAAPSQLRTRDPEFLPAALEILVTPASPIAMWLMALISFTVVAGLAWSYFGWLDIHAVAAGKIQPSGRSKVVQPLEPGRVVVIRVENGSRVETGDVLLELDPTETAADREAQARDLESARAEAARRQAGVAAAETALLTALPIAFVGQVGDAVRRREEAALAADLAQLKSNLGSLQAQIAEKEATKERLKASIAARERLIKLSRERVGMREEIETRGAGSRALVIEALQQLETQITTDVGERGQLGETDAAIVSLQRKLDQTLTQFIAEQVQKLVEIERKRDRVEQELIKATSKSDRTVLKAPIAGTVQQLNVTTVGQVVTTRQALLTIVPLEGQIEVEAMIANKDIGFVKAGQRAVVKVEAFPFTRYGVIDAEVLKVSRDAVDDREAVSMTDAATSARPEAVANTAARTQALVFPATLRLARHRILVDGEQVPLSPGMAVAVEIKTGKRRAIDYILSPLREMVAQSAHER
jgi:hemolysin D